MASRCRSLSQPAVSLIRSTISKSSNKPKPSTFLHHTRSPPTFPRAVPHLGCAQSLLPFHSAISSARLTSCLGIDSRNSRSLSQGMLCSANPGV
ncbi:protein NONRESPONDING TO OXYLIPINS 2, mitochondrial isoform X2 [Prosopis cineraria]|uniref:protein NONRESPONDING TO OXYLIPINS 2, mitochondrial isoform X2 n=1 Tax=Prosopis cineraria TaxID=364024 RepID=UPI002410281E|nr:protein NONRESPONDING TO OXYLIPINS 2, mitochondrial isoform X2 [Prosopis cineraria]XP_054789042.1 protein NONRESPONDING TO OXYLIPINS 2, mitochondrial isoform X2 [Prosopis cineraria]